MKQKIHRLISLQETTYSLWELLFAVVRIRPINSQPVVNRPRRHRLILILELTWMRDGVSSRVWPKCKVIALVMCVNGGGYIYTDLHP